MPGTCPNVHGAPARNESIADFSISRRRAAATALAAAALPLAPGRTCAQTERAPGERAPGGGPARKTLLGVYVAHDLLALREFEGIIGRRVDGVLEYTHSREWSDMGPSRHLSNVLGQSGRGIFWSMPHYAAWESRDNGLADMRAVAAGARDADFVRWGRELLARGKPAADGNFYLRVAWEMPGEWFPWSLSAKQDPAAFRASVCRYARALRSVSNKFKIVWDFNSDRGPVEQYYPGDDCVDVISQDIYWTLDLQGKEPRAAFNRHVSGYSRGLAWMAEFAAAHGKPMAISEFGVDASARGAEIWLELFADWVRSHNVVYIVYWYSNDAFPGIFGRNARVSNAFKRLFGGQ
ncbi:MAG TPA: glycosyl hydrolase [Acetobacteraceae bacterium]|nr:glycosyl hydrolase [Acetobacteraceae bacterium]